MRISKFYYKDGTTWEGEESNNPYSGDKTKIPHREDGPTEIHFSDEGKEESLFWYVDGKLYNKNENEPICICFPLKQETYWVRELSEIASKMNLKIPNFTLAYEDEFPILQKIRNASNDSDFTEYLLDSNLKIKLFAQHRFEELKRA